MRIVKYILYSLTVAFIVMNIYYDKASKDMKDEIAFNSINIDGYSYSALPNMASMPAAFQPFKEFMSFSTISDYIYKLASGPSNNEALEIINKLKDHSTALDNTHLSKAYIDVVSNTYESYYGKYMRDTGEDVNYELPNLSSISMAFIVKSFAASFVLAICVCSIPFTALGIILIDIPEYFYKRRRTSLD